MSMVGPGGGHSREFLLWVADRPRTYAEAMEAWRTSCPRLSAWEDAMADDLIRVDTEGVAAHGQAAVRLTQKAAILLSKAAEIVRPSAAARPAAAASDHCAPLLSRCNSDVG